MLGQEFLGNVLHRCFIKKIQGQNLTGIILQSFSYFALRTYTGHAILKGMILSVLDCPELFHQLVSSCLPKMLQQHRFFFLSATWFGVKDLRRALLRLNNELPQGNGLQMQALAGCYQLRAS